MSDCPFNPSDSPCELEMDLMILREAKRESLEIFYAMRNELQFCLKRIQLLEAILTDKGIPVPDYEDCSFARLAEPLIGGIFRQSGGFSPAARWIFSVHVAASLRYMHFCRFSCFFRSKASKRAWACSLSERYCRFISIYFCSVISLSA